MKLTRIERDELCKMVGFFAYLGIAEDNAGIANIALTYIETLETMLKESEEEELKEDD